MENEKKIISLLYANPIFSKLGIEDMKKIMNFLELVSYKKGDVIFREGDIGDSVYFIVKGSVGIYKKKNFLGISRDVKLFELRCPEALGELSIFDNFLRSATAVAESDCELLKLTRNSFAEMERMDIRPAYHITKSILMIVTRRLRKTTEELVKFM
jgi:NTE family protein